VASGPFKLSLARGRWLDLRLTMRACLTHLPPRAPADRFSDRGLPGHPSLQRFLPTLATGPSRVESSSLPFPILRCRGFEDFSRPFDAPPPFGADGLRGRVDAFTRITVIHGSSRSLLSWSFPPFEVTILALLPASSELLSWASIVNSSSRRLASSRAPVHVRSSEFQRSRRLARSLRAPLHGVWVDTNAVSPPKRESSRHCRLPVDATDVAFRERGSAPLTLRAARSKFDYFSTLKITSYKTNTCSFFDTFSTFG